MMSSMMNMAMLALEAQQVVFLRTLKLAGGGDAAAHEAYRMVAEKVVAAQEATLQLMTGGTADHVISRYRKKVRANARRLGSKRVRPARTKA
jgi:hypothetical protein